ncbi:hypothetical protein G4H71_08755 [Rhodococcus triatomae]|uniref:DUF7144 domain-containing protein n=1 Tax=Rhodococcus triatomae TaxID=300028 RepID=A0A1G8I852_9NOCA|nr:hypothetical protein [Rhodococcus triatomae]QNG20975.1 hypothetical protein G4H72_21630 [Rhodococcus triatomae]QNG23110.1 hypothetical protein G4H71_08755 [Rhodococcus triatomae]SDI14750.1 hypothetical protein SAMN05444695_105182 [Rhodococcus triatomae]
MSTRSSSTSGSPVRQGIAMGTTLVAAALLLVAGIVSLFQGIAAVASDEIFVVGIDYTYAFDVTTWGWIHIVVGVLVIIAAFGLITGATWARVAAIVLASLSIIANFLWLPYYPLWAILVIALDVVVIWAVATWDSEAL